MKLMASPMLTAAIKRQYNSALPLWGFVTSPFASFCPNLCNGNAFLFVFLRVIKLKIVTTPLDRAVALVLFVINWTRTAAADALASAISGKSGQNFGARLGRFGRITEKWPDSGFAGVEIRHNPLDCTVYNASKVQVRYIGLVLFIITEVHRHSKPV